MSYAYDRTALLKRLRKSPDSLFTAGEVGALVNVDSKTVGRWEKDGKLPASVRTPGKHKRWDGRTLAPFVGHTYGGDT